MGGGLGKSRCSGLFSGRVLVVLDMFSKSPGNHSLLCEFISSGTAMLHFISAGYAGSAEGCRSSFQSVGAPAIHSCCAALGESDLFVCDSNSCCICDGTHTCFCLRFSRSPKCRCFTRQPRAGCRDEHTAVCIFASSHAPVL